MNNARLDGPHQIDALLARHDVYRPIDLFIDNPQTVARNRLIRALVAGNVETALEALGQFSHAGAGHDELTAAETLVDALSWPGDAELQPAAGLEFLEQQLVPAARRLLDRGADAWLAPYWSRLADAIDPRQFDPGQPKLHPGWPALFLPTPDPMGQDQAGRTVNAKARETYNTARALHNNPRDLKRRIALRDCAPELLARWLEIQKTEES